VSGVIEGGWEFVWAAYAVTTMVFLIYTGSVLSRYRKERKRDRESAGES
jgi:cbb3-type cytochrome oxidase subunit 3